MSAFAGFVGFSSSVSPDIAVRLRNTLDGVGLGRARTFESDSAALVFRQRIVAPEDLHERQPIAGDGVVSMFDGRLDNRADLLALLGLTGRGDAPMPDGEIVRRAYLHWREEAPCRLLGSFAWALWHDASRRLMLARDHSPHRSLYFCRAEGGFAFATGYRPLLALPGVPADVDEIAAADLLLVAPDESDRSIYKHISWVGSAMRVLITPDGVHRRRFWEPAIQPLLRFKSDHEYVEVARAVFAEAVACRRRVAGPIVSTVSGGLDSSAVTATAAMQEAPRSVQAICLVPSGDGPMDLRGEGNYGDESPYVEALAHQHSNLRVHYLTPRLTEAMELDPTGLFVQFAAPIVSPNNGPWFLAALRKAAELGASTLLTGTMGNVTFSAAGQGFLAGLLRQGASASFFREAWHMARGPHPEGLRRLRAEVLSLLPRAVVPHLRRLKGLDRLRWQSLPFNPDFVREAGLAERLARLGAGMDPWLPDRLLPDLRFMFVRGRMLMEGAAMLRMLSGVTASDPFSDRRIIDFCLSLPADQFRRGGTQRRFARTVFRDRLPPEILENTRRGTQNVEWFRRLAPHRDQFAADLERFERSPLVTRLLDVPRLQRALVELPTDEEEAYRSNWLLKFGFFRGLHLGRYLAWIDSGNQQSSVTDSRGES